MDKTPFYQESNSSAMSFLNIPKSDITVNLGTLKQQLTI